MNHYQANSPNTIARDEHSQHHLSAADQATPASASAVVPAAETVRTGARPATIIIGLLVAMIGLYLIAVSNSRWSVDGLLTLVLFLSLAGLILIGSAIVGAIRSAPPSR
jgi:hypothetical protein